MTSEDRQEVQQIAKEEIKKNAINSQFQVTPVPAHTHNGVDSLLVDYSNIARLNLPNLNRIIATTATATPTPNASITDIFDITAQTATAATASFQPPSGTPVNGQWLELRITSSATGTPRGLSFSTATGGYLANSPALPGATVTGKTTILGFQYDTANSVNKWRLVYSSNS